MVPPDCSIYGVRRKRGVNEFARTGGRPGFPIDEDAPSSSSSSSSSISPRRRPKRGSATQPEDDDEDEDDDEGEDEKEAGANLTRLDGKRRLHGGKILFSVFAPHQDRIPLQIDADGSLSQRPNVRGDVPDRQPAAPTSGEVRSTAVNHQTVVQGHLACLQHTVHGPRFVFGADLHFLIDAEQISAPLRLTVFLDVTAMLPRNDAHATVVAIAVVDRQPRRHLFERLQSPVRQILMPGHELVTRSVLAEELRRQHQDIRTVKRLDAVQNAGIRRELPDELVFVVAVEQLGLRTLSALLRFELVELLPASDRLFVRDDADAGDEAVVVVPFDLLTGQFHVLQFVLHGLPSTVKKPQISLISRKFLRGQAAAVRFIDRYFFVLGHREKLTDNLLREGCSPLHSNSLLRRQDATDKVNAMRKTAGFVGLFRFLSVGIFLTSKSEMAAGGGETLLDVFSDGSDGDFAPTSSIEIDLSAALSRKGVDWQTPSLGADPKEPENGGSGVYDPAKWAVVFKYSSVNIPPGVTVTYTNHETRCRVVWLVEGDCSIDGTVDVSPQTVGVAGTRFPADPGPGGFRGGFGYTTFNTNQTLQSAGFGPGGGTRAGDGGGRGGTGSHSTQGAGDGPGRTYGNDPILPLVGGSGAGGGTSSGDNRQGGARGGAILIAAGSTLSVDGAINADGRTVFNNWNNGGSASAIRLIGNHVVGTGSVNTLGASAQGRGGDGRIRVESYSNKATLSQGNPPYIFEFSNNPALIWPPADAPTIRIRRVSSAFVGDIDVSTDPKARLDGPFNADVTLETEENVTVEIAAENVPLTHIVTVRVVPRNGEAEEYQATSEPGSDDLVSTWTVE